MHLEYTNEENFILWITGGFGNYSDVTRAGLEGIILEGFRPLKRTSERIVWGDSGLRIRGHQTGNSCHVMEERNRNLLTYPAPCQWNEILAKIPFPNMLCLCRDQNVSASVPPPLLLKYHTPIS